MRFGKWRNSLLIGAALTGAGTVLWLSVYVKPFTAVKGGYQPSDVWVLDRYGNPLEAVRTQNQIRSLEWVKLDEVSSAFIDILIRTEDKRFRSHPGVDALALLKAALERMTGPSRRGASTLTMQTTGLVKKGNPRGLKAKALQIVSALKMNAYWSKDEVLEAYVNLVPFRGELVGLRAASIGYFGKNPSGLNAEESAMLAAMIRSPNAPPQLVSKRACAILSENDCSKIERLVTNTLTRPYSIQRPRQILPVLSQKFVEKGWDSSVIQTSIDKRIQDLALSALREQLLSLKQQNVSDGAVLVLETKSGRVVAYAANAGAGYSSASQTDGIAMKRQAGSTVKPFVYATAFDERILTPSALLDDSPADITISKGRVYHPKNYDHIFRGPVSAGDALGSSMNVPAVKALQLIGEEKALDKMRALGFDDLEDDDFYGPSLALGAVDVSLWELTHAYRRLAIPGEIFSDSARGAIYNILASSEHRRFTFGTSSILTLPFAAPVKTGTSKDMRDNWCVGWTPHYTIGVWVGNFSGEPMWNVSGISGAAPVWREMMLALHPNPSGPAARYEPPAEKLPRRTLSGIRYPASDMLVGFDPDIPVSLQKVPIEIDNPQPNHDVFLNNKFLGRAQEVILWPVKRGKFKVELKARGKTLDQVNFEVR